jgi:hypothetical protein
VHATEPFLGKLDLQASNSTGLTHNKPKSQQAQNHKVFIQTELARLSSACEKAPKILYLAKQTQLPCLLSLSLFVAPSHLMYVSHYVSHYASMSSLVSCGNVYKLYKL